MPIAPPPASSHRSVMALLLGLAVAGCAAPGTAPGPTAGVTGTSSPGSAASAPLTPARVGAQAACDRGWSHVRVIPEVVPEGVAALDHELWIAGGADLGGGRREAAVLHVPTGGAPEVMVPPPPDGRDSGLMAIAATSEGEPIWTVGYGREVDHVAAYSAQQEGGSWRDVRAVPPEGRHGALTDVATSPALGTWASGFSLGPPGDQRPWALQWREGAWATVEPPLSAGEKASLSATSVSDEGGVWVAGTAFAGPDMRPYVARRDGDAWIRDDFEAGQQAALADIVVPHRDRGWAVGHRLAGAGFAPLLLGWDGTAWKAAHAPDLGSAPTLLSAVSESDGVLSVGGATWDQERRRYVPFAARRATPDGDWDVSVGRPGWGGGTVTDIVGDPGTTGWIVGRAEDGFMARICAVAVEPAAEPVVDASAAIASAAARETAARETAAPAASTTMPARPLAGTIVARDVAAEVGLPTESQSWGATAADFDADGDIDLFLGRHGARARLFRNDGGVFSEADVRFGGGDRHGCAAADVDDSGLPDLYCAFGAMRGTGTKQNQLWLDPGGVEPILEPWVGGASEPLGRGRQPRFLDIDEDGDLDLFLGQEAKRMDGLPSTNRGFLRTGPATFEATPLPGIDAGLAAEAIDIADFDGDGRDDILFVYRAMRALEPTAGVRLYRNEPGVAFSDVTEASGIESLGERDAILADLDGDGRPDLVQLAHDRVVVSIARDGRFERVAEEGVHRGAALASGDADGDGDLDLYVHQGKSADGGRDLLLLNDGRGRTFARLDLPVVTGGSEDAVVALDYDGDGRMDFLALNGRNSARGPVQLITLESEG